jgi:hypothetical protein
MRISRASLWFRERSGLTPTRRGPAPTIAPGLNKTMDVPVSPPLPRPSTLLVTQGVPPPDRGLSSVWPHGVQGELPQ